MIYPVAKNMNMYQNCGQYPFNNRLPARNVAFTSQADTIRANNHTGLSKNAKLGLGALIVAGIGTVAYILSRGKVGSNSAQKLAEHIDFKEAKTMKDAIKFAKENFGIKLDLGDNLFAANFINESCVNISNSMKGKAYFPKKIKFGLINNSRKATGGYDSISNTLVINNENSGSTGFDCYKAFNEVLKTRGSYLEYSRHLKSNKIFNNMRETIYHEFGHCNHNFICKDFKKMGKLKELEELGISDKSIINEFLNDKTIQDTVVKVSKYSKESPAEFVAEVFSKRMLGHTFSDDVMSLYVKYGGPV